MKKVLFIAYLFPPIANSGTQRSVKFANNLLHNGWQPTVLTIENPPDRSIDDALLKEVDSGLTVVRAPMQSENICRRLTCLLPKKLAQKVTSGLEWRIRSLQQQPDEYVSWVNSAYQRALSLHAEHQFDLIYVTGMPWSSFLIADKLKQKTAVPYVLDYRDLWNNTDLGWESQAQTQNKNSLNLEARLLKNADAVISTTHSFVNKLMRDQKIPSEQQHKYHCITNGYEPKEFLAAQKLPAKLAKQSFNIVYTGVWKTGYNISRLLEAIALLIHQQPELNIKLYTAGYDQKYASQYGLNSAMVEFGRVSHKTALKMMLEADLLYLPIPDGNVGHMQLPGKLFEYVGSGKTILADLALDSEAANILAKTGGADIGPSASVAALAERILKHYHRQIVVKPRVESACYLLQRAAQAEQLAHVFNQLLSDKRQ